MFIRKKTLEGIKLNEFQRGFNCGAKTTRENEGFLKQMFDNLAGDNLKLREEIKKLKTKKR